MKKLSLLTFVLSASSLFFLSSCNNDNCQVTLNAKEGIFYNDKSSLSFNVKKGTKLNEIDGYETPRPTLPNQTFKGWTASNKEIKENYVIENNIEIDAVFIIEELTHTVTLDANGGYFNRTSITTKNIYDVSSLSYADCQIPNHKKSSDITYHFDGWYYDKDAKDPVIFDLELEEDITIYAGWGKETKDPFILTSSDGTPIEPINNVYHITTAGEYNLSGCAVDSQIYINSASNADIDITLNLNSVAFYSSNKDTAIIITKKINKVTFNALDGTTNYIYDSRTYGDTTCSDDNGAIDAKCDLTFTGNGELYINDQDIAPGYKRAIQTSKKLTIENLSLSAYGMDGAIKAKREILINNADVNIISPLGDGLKTEDVDVKDNKRNGDIVIKGHTTLDIDCAMDAIDASHDVIIGENEEIPVINIMTSEFSFYTQEVPVDKKDLYLRASYSPDTHYDNSQYWCSIYFNTGDWERVKLKKSIAKTSQPGPSGTHGYYYSFNAPLEATSFEIYLFDVSVIEESTSSYIKKSDVITIDSYYDTLGSSRTYVDFTSTNIASPTTVNGKYTSLTSSSNHSCGVNYSNKGLKADNEIIIYNGDIDIKSYDDAIHTSYGTFYPGEVSDVVNSTVGNGDITIYNGDIDISSGDSNIKNTGDDAIHSAGTLTIEGGSLDIDYCYEGLEAATININGGVTKVFAYDDAVNATNQGIITSPNIYINGGVLDVTANGNDVDGIDSNGNFYQNNGLVITRGNPSGSSMSSGLDVDGEAKINGGAFLCLGARPEKTPSYSDNVTYLNPLEGSSSSGSHTLVIGETINYSYVNNTTYSGSYLYYLTSLGTPIIN